MIKALGGEPLKEGIGVPAAAHAVDHLGTVQIFLHHLVHGVDVILTIAVNGDGDVAVVGAGLHQARQHGVLMAPVPALGNADKMRILLCKAADELPGLVAGAIVDEQHPALVADHAFFGEAGDLARPAKGSLIRGAGERSETERFIISSAAEPPAPAA